MRVRANNASGGGGNGTACVPQMTSATAPSGEVISSTVSGDTESRYAFDNDETNYCQLTNSVGAYIGYNFGIPLKLKKLYLAAAYNNNIAYKLQGSNDGSTWEDITTFTGVAQASKTLYTVYVNSNTAYKQFRLYHSTTGAGYSTSVYYDVQFCCEE